MFVTTIVWLIYILNSIESSIISNATVVLVTGSSRGIGKSIVLEFAKSIKYKVYATMRDTTHWIEPLKDNIILWQMDVTSDESISSTIQHIIKEEGKIDLVINNAGYAIVGCLESVQMTEAQAEFDVNFWGIVRVLQAALPYMREARRGHIINLSSLAGIRGKPALDFYTASKFAIEGLMDSMRYSLYPYNIHVTNINPGPVRTEFGDNAIIGTRQVAKDTEHYIKGYTHRFLEEFKSRLQSTEAQTSEEVAKLVVNVAILARDKTKFTEVPFNIGGNKASQMVIESVRKNPTGWGGIYTDILLTVPPIESTKGNTIKSKLSLNTEL